MGSVVDSLKRLYKKIGGGKVKGPIAIDDLVDKIADQMSSGGSGSNIFMINDTLEGSAHTLDKTYEEIETAFLSGKTCIVHTTKLWNGGGVPRDTNAYDNVFSVVRDASGQFNLYTSNSYTALAVDQYPFWDED